jgi:hypothetical protein
MQGVGVPQAKQLVLKWRVHYETRVQHLSGDAYVNAYFRETVTHAKCVGLKAIPLITLFQDMHSVKAMPIRNQTFNVCVFRVILPKGVGFLIGKGHP